MSESSQVSMVGNLAVVIEQYQREFDAIPDDRKEILHQLANYVGERIRGSQEANLNFICTHNSRRSHIAQIWAQAAAAYFGIKGVLCYSGGTEATAFNPRAVKALREIGFAIDRTSEGSNPFYHVLFSSGAAPIIAFSKKYDAPVNPMHHFGAIMTCSHADQNCPLVLGATARFSITYDDPKDFDDTPLETEKYRERVHQIGREMVYAFSLLSVKRK